MAKPGPASPLPRGDLPKGGGALAPIGEKFSANAQTGTAGFSIALPITHGRGAVTPQLALAYDSGAGNGPFGVGWSVAVPAITRKTDRGLPRYPKLGAVDDDVFVLSGAEDLVPVSSPTPNADGELVVTYRPRVDAAFAQLERRLRTDGSEYWVAITKDNLRSVFGDSEQARLADPDDPTRVFRWYLEWTDDDRGNVVAYHYKAEDPDPRRPIANRYLKAIAYLNPTPRLDRTISPIAEPLETWPLVVLFNYGDHALTDVAAGTREVLAELPWPERPDAFSNRRSTFEMRTKRLCTDVLMLHRVADTGELDPGATHAVARALRLQYTSTERITYLDAVTQEGWRRRSDGSYDVARWPTVRLAYTDAEDPNLGVEVLDRASSDGLLAAFDGHAAQLLDYDGEGLPGVFSSEGGAWWYKRPNGAPEDSSPRWSPPRRIARHPDVALGGNGAQLQDWNSDGAIDVVQLRGAMRGVYARQPMPPGRELLDDDWHPFRPFAELPPNVDFGDPNLRFADLDGDGFPDILVSYESEIRWHAARAGIDARGRDGYADERRVPKLGDLDEPHLGRAPIFANHAEAVLLADMTGDGLADVVHVTASACTYWPNLGYGRFGRRVVMQRAPILAARQEFDPARVRFADFDGTGTADLVYLDAAGVRVHANLAGNAFGIPVVIPLSQPGQVDILDLWGRGTPTVTWSSSQPRDRDRHVRFVDLYPTKPHLLTSVDNGFGLVHTIEYGTSTRHYLADRRAGRPWITRLPFPVHVIDRITTVDAVAGTRAVATYRYHHGYFDGPERELRGFGMVEVRDSEDFGAFYGAGDAAVAGLDRALHRPTVVTKTWFHTGAFIGNDAISSMFAGEYDRTDPLAVLLPDTELPAGLQPEEAREAVRALRGHPLRVEIYAEDADAEDPASVARAARPYEVVETNYTIRLERARGESRHPVFSVHARETLHYHYERLGGDPRVAHRLAITISPTGVPVDQVAIGYPRRGFDPVTVANNLRAQGVLYATLAHVELRDPSPHRDAYRRDVVVRDETYELVGLASGHVLAFSEVAAFVAGAVECPYSPSRRLTDRSGFATGKHLMRRTRHRYYDAMSTGVLAVDEVDVRVLPARTEALTHTSVTLGLVVAREPALDLASLLTSPAGGYVRDPDDSYWAPSATASYDPDHFFAVIAATSPFGGVSRVTLDPLYVLPIATYDVMANPTTITNDYRLFQPRAVTDSNGTTAAVETDVLGVVVASSVRQGVSGGQVHAIDYAFFHPTTGAPTRVHGRAFTEYAGSGAGSVEEFYLYSDGSGREALRKVLVPAGPALLPDGSLVMADPRWLGSGQIIRDNKEQPVKQYEPYFSTTFEFESEALLVGRGVTPVMRYDPTNRLIRVDLPDGTYRDTTFDPWSQTARDEIDTLDAGVPWYEERRVLPTTDPRRIAADRAFALRATPALQHVDGLGRTIVSSRDNQSGVPIETATELDVLGNKLTVIDPRGTEVATTLYDHAGRPVEVASADAGLCTTVQDAAGKPMIVWRGVAPTLVRVAHDYDHAERAVATRVVDANASGEIVRERTVYRDWIQGPPPPNGAGRVAAELDGAGLVVHTYDFAGRSASVTRRVMLDHATIPSWNAATTWDGTTSLPAALEAMLDGEAFATTVEYDALDRPVRETAPDGSVTTRGYDIAGRLISLAVTDPSGTRQPIVAGVDFDEKGRRKTLRWGHSVTSTYDYDPRTFRLSHLHTEGPNHERYQDLDYTYDAVGNVIRIHDDADDTLYYGNAVARPELDYTYDALYRLTRARGREHARQAAFDQRDVPAALGAIPIVATTDLAQIAEYAELYTYDAADNLTSFTHQHGSQSPWLRTYDLPAGSNRLAATHVGGVDAPYTYDSRGNSRSMAHLQDMRWTHRDQLWVATRTKVGNGPVPADPVAPDSKSQPVYFAYDQRGQRIRKTSENGALVRDRIYVGSFEVYREIRSGKLGLERTTLHAGDGGCRLASLECRTPRSADDGSPAALWRFQHDNHLGSAVLELSEQRIPLSYEELHPYGTTAVSSLRTGIPAKRYRFSGMERDDETGLSCHGVRYYAPWLGRWTSPDPSGLADGTNSFAYAHNNPMRFHDTDGHSAQDAIDDRRSGPLGWLGDVTLGRLADWGHQGDKSVSGRIFRGGRDWTPADGRKEYYAWGILLGGIAAAGVGIYFGGGAAAAAASRLAARAGNYLLAALGRMAMALLREFGPALAVGGGVAALARVVGPGVPALPGGSGGGPPKPPEPPPPKPPKPDPKRGRTLHIDLGRYGFDAHIRGFIRDKYDHANLVMELTGIPGTVVPSITERARGGYVKEWAKYHSISTRQAREDLKGIAVDESLSIGLGGAPTLDTQGPLLERVNSALGGAEQRAIKLNGMGMGSRFTRIEVTFNDPVDPKFKNYDWYQPFNR